jgi:hypothetical protein
MQVSYIIPVLNSHEIVRRQILFWERMELPDDVEIIIMDDGSDPPLSFDTDVVRIYPTHETRPWTSSIARNKGARIAKGRNLIMADVDYIIPKDVIMRVREFTGQKIQFSRQFGVLDENGEFTQDKDVLLQYGLQESRYAKRGTRIPFHPNHYAMNREVFWEIGGYNERLVFRRPYPQGEDNQFKKAWHRWVKAGKGEAAQQQSMVYMFPCGQFCGDVDYNPFGLFHNLTRKTDRNIFWHRQLRREAAQ